MNLILQHHWQRLDLSAAANICGFYDVQTAHLCSGMPLEIDSKEMAEKWADRLERTAVWTHTTDEPQARESYAVMMKALRMAKFPEFRKHPVRP